MAISFVAKVLPLNLIVAKSSHATAMGGCASWARTRGNGGNTNGYTSVAIDKLFDLEKCPDN